MKRNLLLFFFSLSSLLVMRAQNTVGLLTNDPNQSFEGYNLFFPHGQPDVYLINNCGEIVNIWEDDPMYRPGNMVYLLENGNLLKCKRDNQPVSYPIWAGGGGAIVELRDWDNNLLWSFEQNDSLRRLHHDIEPLPNGNILMISWEYKSEQEAIQAGRDPDKLTSGKLWPDYILEVDPDTDEVVWEWHVWDHLIQDFDLTQDNFGVVVDHPELVDINYDTSDGKADWMHTNAIDYNPDLDQILISVPTFSEVWVIDHSTTTEEAAGHTGGQSGRGGDLLYRWGNPVAYQSGDASDQKLFYPHDIQWIRDFLTPDHPDYGKLGVFNNRVSTDYSTVNIFNPPFDPQTGDYLWDEAPWGPDTFDLTVTHPDTTRLVSGGLSSMQVLPNDNLLICSGRIGYVFEVTPGGEIVWEYLAPLNNGTPVPQGTILDGTNNTFVFRFKRYPADYAAFQGRDLTPQGYIELAPDEDFCDQLSPALEPVTGEAVSFFPNPATDRLRFSRRGERLVRVEVFDTFGRPVYASRLGSATWEVDVSAWPAGVYWVRIERAGTRKLVISR